MPTIKPAQSHKHNTNTETVRIHNKTLNTQIKSNMAEGKKNNINEVLGQNSKTLKEHRYFDLNCHMLSLNMYYRGADKSLARPERKQDTTTEDAEFHISYIKS